MMIGLKRDTTPIRIPIMESLKEMQSLEFYKLYGDAVGGVYGVTPEFVSVTTPFSGVDLKINVQNRTTEDHQSNFADLYNDGLLPLFNVTDWILYFKPVEAKDELRLEQVGHTRAAAALTWLRGGFEVSIDEETGSLMVKGTGKLPEIESGPGARLGEPPRSMEGKPGDEGAGSPATSAGERLELSKTEKIVELGEGVIQPAPPYGVVNEKETLAAKLKKIREWAKTERKKTRKRNTTIIQEALVKADKVITDSYQELINTGLAHAKSRTGVSSIVLSPEELKRLDKYRENTIADFKKILEDTLKRR